MYIKNKSTKYIVTDIAVNIFDLYLFVAVNHLMCQTIKKLWTQNKAMRKKLRVKLVGTWKKVKVLFKF